MGRGERTTSSGTHSHRDFQTSDQLEAGEYLLCIQLPHRPTSIYLTYNTSSLSTMPSSEAPYPILLACRVVQEE